MKRLFYFIAVAGAVLVSCVKEDSEDGNGKKPADDYGHEFTAIIKEEFKTRTSIDGMKLNWGEGDAIELYTENGTYPYEMVEAGHFKSEVTPDGKVLYAAYPAENAVYSAAGLTMTLPSEREYDETGITAVPLFAEISKDAAEISSIEFGIPVGMFQINYSGVPEGYSALVCTSTGCRISGTFRIEDGTLSATSVSDQNITTVKFDALTSEKDMSFYIPAPVGTYASIDFKLTGEGKADLPVAGLSDYSVEKGIIYQLTARQDLNISWGNIDGGDLVFTYGEGGSRDYPVISNTDWTVSSDNPDITAVKKDEQTVTVTVPAGNGIGGRSATITIGSADPLVIVAPASLTVTQENNPEFTVEFGEVVYNPDGSVTFNTYPEGDGKQEVKKSYIVSSEKKKFGTYTFEFDEIDLSSGFFHMENWMAANSYIYLQLGQYNRVYYNDGSNPIEEDRVTAQSYYFNKFTYDDLRTMKTVQMKLIPASKEGSSEYDDMKILVIIDGETILEKNVGANPWKDEERSGLTVHFGINNHEDVLASSIRLKSYSYSEEY